MKKGEIYYADLSPVVGSEQGGVRPVVIIQNNIGNLNSPTVIVACVTTKCRSKRPIKTHVMIADYEKCGLKEESMVMLEQLKTIDKSRITNWVGEVGELNILNIDQAILISLGIKTAHGSVNGSENKIIT